ncbi:ankyrin repeat and SAM domain-containing protein 4B [Eublepharis macularius]|uniref:Ankyrin repeat and SAM domain-containing protein 4B n=1 Tax=Eublepharis macularius TaxID=481883 RepID=A0AA97K370_EUBMA|nr:ankyrin repeat and SAM domain-containing protein 4B [Eublepharis macularius]
MSTRYHQAAMDGNLELLKEATRKDLNTADTDGMTPTLLAAYHGHLEAVEVICRRGGDPDKCDIWGNTPLHHAASNGHIHCVSFLINFGANIFSLDNNMRSALDAAANRNQYECVQILDNAATEQGIKNPKRVSRLKAHAQRDVQRQIRECERRQERHEHEMIRHYNKTHAERETPTRTRVSNFFTTRSLGALPKHLKDTFRLKTKKKEEDSEDLDTGSNNQAKDIPVGRTTVMDMFSENEEEEPENLGKTSVSEDGQVEQESIFNRPGLGNIVFRNNLATGITAAPVLPEKEEISFQIPDELFQFKRSEVASDPDLENVPEESWIEEEIGWDDGSTETTPLEVFLASLELNEFLPILMREDTDLETLMLCSDEDLQSIQMQLGPRKKILHAVNRRKEALAKPGKAEDTKL